MEVDVYENRDFCAKCGGRCCKKSGCDYFVSDFDKITLEVLREKLDTDRVSVVAVLDFKMLPNGTLTAVPLLCLRSRNINRDIIDLISMRTTCASLQEDGCYYSRKDRPGGAVHLIPRENPNDCYSDVDRIEELKKWVPYQKFLERLVKQYTGKSVSQKMREDVKQLLFDVLNENFDGVSKDEISDILSGLPLLAAAFPKEADEAYKKYHDSKCFVLKKHI